MEFEDLAQVSTHRRTFQARLNYIEEHTADLTDTYLRFILNELDGYMGPRGGGNSFVAASIVQHCGSQAQLGRTNLRLEKRAVRDAYVQCYGTCGDDEEEDDDFYDVPEEVLVGYGYFGRSDQSQLILFSTGTRQDMYGHAR